MVHSITTSTIVYLYTLLLMMIIPKCPGYVKSVDGIRDNDDDEDWMGDIQRLWWGKKEKGKRAMK